MTIAAGVDELALFRAAEADRAKKERAATAVQARVRGARARTLSKMKSMGHAASQALAGAPVPSTLVRQVSALGGSRSLPDGLVRQASSLAGAFTPAKGIALADAALETTKGMAAGTVLGAGELARRLWRNPAAAASDMVGLLQKSPDVAAGLLRSLATANGGLEAILQLGSAMRDTADSNWRRQYVALLRRSVGLTLSITKSALRRESVLSALRARINSALASLHLSEGMPLEEEGVLSNYRLELLRLNATQSQALRAMAVYPVIGGRKSKKPVHHYQVVRKVNLLEKDLFFPAGRDLQPSDVHQMGFLHEFSIKVAASSRKATRGAAAPAAQPAAAHVTPSPPPASKPSPSASVTATSQPSAATPAASDQARQGESPAPEPLEQVDAFIDAQYRCCGEPLKRCLPKWWKAQLPFEVGDTWLPLELRERADEVLTLELDLDMTLVFDPESGTAEASAHATAEASALGFGPVRFQFQLTGSRCWPTLAQITVRSVHFRASCKVWWDVFQQQLLLAFNGQAADDEGGGSSAAVGAAAPPEGKCGGPRFDTDIDLSFFGCGMPLPTDIEARLLSNLVTMALQAHNHLNPYVIDLREFESAATDNAAASVVQAAARASKARKKSTLYQVKSNRSHAKDLEAKVERMEAEITQLRAELNEVRQQQGALNLGLSAHG